MPDPAPVDSPACHQSANRTNRFNVDQMRDNERRVTPGELVSNGIGHDTVGEQLHDHRGIQNDRRPSRNSRMTCAGVRLDGIRFAWAVRSHHSCIAGLATRSKFPPKEVGKAHAFARRPCL